MDPSLQSLLSRLANLSDQPRELREGVQKAIQIADTDPEMALTRARKVLEYVIRDVYERRINEPPGTRPLENLCQRLVKDGFFPDRLDAYASTIRKLGNVGTHSFGTTVVIADVYQSLAQLLPILEWYFETEAPAIAEGKPSPQMPPAIEKKIDDATTAISPRVAVIPKGLRSFDAHDADFFLDLLPGPRDKEGLPESIRFWKHRIESVDEASFTVGVVYGPSGCGKSSLLKAGLLPRLGHEIRVVHVEATADETEARLLKGLRKQCTEWSADSSLIESLTTLRQDGKSLAGKKILIVVDQFEQWLHAKQGEQNTELAQALRQCDGEHIQCLLLVRDDFWLALSRFMGDLHIGLVQDQNIALVDLFDLIHARRVLAAFGRAFGRLNEPLSRDQESFLDQTVQGLAQNGRVISVRLALFAEMVKGRPWTPATLKAIGGTAGVGVSFLEETFRSAAANAKNRLHQQAARGVLKALLPEQGADIKGNMRSYDELLAASGYVHRPRDFEELLRILDGELRLITPTDREAIETDDQAESTRSKKYYQLTHDYLVPSLRDWLTGKQRETRRGRAELRLSSRAALWSDKPENRRLPSLWEYVNIRLLTNRKSWTPAERMMMRRAGRVHGLQAAIAAVLLVAIVIGGREVSGRVAANSLVEQLVAADAAEVPKIVDKLARYRRWANPLLHQEDDRAETGSKQKLYASLALLPLDASKVDYLRDRLLLVSPAQFSVVRDALAPYMEAISEPLWNAALDTGRETRERFQAACALASYAPDDDRWSRVGAFVAGHLVTLQASDLVAWREALRPAKSRLVAPLSAIYRNAAMEQQQRSFATETLADYLKDQPEALVDLLADAEHFQFHVIFARLKSKQAVAAALAEKELANRADEKSSEDEKERSAKRQANLAAMLLRIGKTDNVWPLLGFSPDSRARSFLIHWISPLKVDSQTIIQRLDAESDVTVRRALVLTLGEFNDAQLPAAQRKPLVEKLLAIVENEPDAGLHGAAEWLLRKWGSDSGLHHNAALWLVGSWRQTNRLDALVEKLRANEQQLQARRTTDKRQWYINAQGQTFAIIDAHEFLIGSAATDPVHFPGEEQYRCRIGRRFAMSTMNVTKAQYARFQAQRPKIARINIDQWVITDDSPFVTVNWYEAAAYCNWLSEQEGIAKEQWCYEPNEKGEYGPGMKAKEKYLERGGYRLPTEAEWEYACRAGSLTSRYYGQADSLLEEYAWYAANGQNRTWPVGSLKPNDFGLFDMLGNTWQWCDVPFKHSSLNPSAVSEDLGSTKPVTDAVSRVLRGGAFDSLSQVVRSACRYTSQPENRSNRFGIRPVRTMP